MSCNTISDALGNGKDRLDQSEIINGVVPGIVSNLKDPEKLGRIKVNFPWMAKESETDWIRVMSLYATGGKGIYFPPEVGDEVLVIFQKGNVNAPYVIGSLWSSKTKPPEENAEGKNNIKLIKTRAGHTITFTDEDSKEKIEIKSKSGNTITMDDASNKEKIEIKSKSGNTITMDDAPGKEKIEIKDKGGGKINMDATQKTITIESGMNLNLKAKMIKIEAQTSLELKSLAIKAQASSMAEIKGAMVKIN